MSEEAYYAALARGPVIPKRLFRQPLAFREGFIPRLAKALNNGLASHRVVKNSLTGERVWLLSDERQPEWWMIDQGIDAAARKLIEMAMDQLTGRVELTRENIGKTLEEWCRNDQWTVLLARDPAARAGNPKTTTRQMEIAQAYATRDL